MSKPNPVAPVIAQLRADGARVGTILGHDPSGPIYPSWQYGVMFATEEQARRARAAMPMRDHDATAFANSYDLRVIVKGRTAAGTAYLLGKVREAAQPAPEPEPESVAAPSVRDLIRAAITAASERSNEVDYHEASAWARVVGRLEQALDLIP